jgi:hypothetical protein
MGICTPSGMGSLAAIARTLLTGIKHPVVIVDWSDMELADGGR